MIFIPLPGEYIASAIRRGNEILGINGIKRSDYKIKSNSRKPIYGYANKIGTNFSSNFKEKNISMKVLYENTLYPLAAVLGQKSTNCEYTPTTNWKICLHCVVEDIRTNGTAFLHLKHQFRSVNFCSNHSVKLYEKCPACGLSITSHKIYKFRECSEFYHLEECHQNSGPHLYAKFINELLSYRGKPYYRHAVSYDIRRRITDAPSLLPGDSLKLKLEKLIAKRTGITISLSSSWELNFNQTAVCCFAAFGTAKEYLKATLKFQQHPHH